MSATIIPFPKNRTLRKALGKQLCSSSDNSEQVSATSMDQSCRDNNTPLQAPPTSIIKSTIKLSLEMSNGQ